jgi:hypothetical protein
LIDPLNRYLTRTLRKPINEKMGRVSHAVTSSSNLCKAAVCTESNPASFSSMEMSLCVVLDAIWGVTDDERSGGAGGDGGLGGGTAAGTVCVW